MAGEGGAERSRRARDADPGRHRIDRSGSSAHARLNGAEHRSAPFERSFRALGSLAFANARVSAAAADLDTGETLLAIDETVALPTAEVGRLLLLVEVAAQLGAGRIAPLDQVAREAGRDADDPRAGGLWSSLLLPSLGVIDAATLVGAVRDPVATNGLIRLVGLDRIRARAESLGLRRTALLDYTRATRGPDDAPQSSVGSTAELQQLFGDLVAGRCVDRGASNRVLGWLAAGSDLSLVASAFGLDPVAHRASDHGLQLVNITGADRGVRSEAGALRGSHRGVSYAVTVEFDDADLETRLGVLDVFRTVGLDLLERVS
ncbi:serine hydrolase [Frondihabitans sp. Leaf304]|uniref:serine hydrolase n=1 Tax=Frondihabitans sp. Leaf304 TaxID=1736329 RepID=UPI0009FE1544|nr:serine hydrolase [Frondihabitans sp. Leaf304]